MKARDLEGFKENLRERKIKSNSNVSANQRLANFRKKVQYGPIFVCSCCHQKLFETQVNLLTDELREKIDIANPEIRRKCIEEEIQVDLGRDKFDNEIKLSYSCKSCSLYLKRGKLPKLCIRIACT